ncbi:YbaN family protein [Marinicella rhabdoformis]|uniref:YbaN family protein n=1 Tax=Marinicella rhabdoformis TaxID=2580566 RepID=UPI0012AEDA0B|nr:YbaN family protein [Marinicella rhabdoformis]
MLDKIKKPFWLLLGFISVVLAVVGVILPLLPTTPFLLLAAFCFSQSSTKAHQWLINHRLFGPLINDWQQHGKIRRKVKVVALSTMALMPILSWFLGASYWALWAQTGVLLLVASFIITRPE